MSSDNTYRTKPDVPFRPAGVGQYSGAKCEARKGYFLCGVAVSKRGVCAECSAARAARRAKQEQAA